MGGMHDGSPGLSEMGEVEPDRFERPAGGPTPAREATPHILVRVDEQTEAVGTGFLHHLDDIVEIHLIIDAGSGMLDGFPGDQKAQEVKAPFTQAPQVLVCLLQWKGAPNEGDMAGVGETLPDIGGSL